MSEDIPTTKQAIDAYLKPAREQMEQRMRLFIEHLQRLAQTMLNERAGQPMDILSPAEYASRRLPLSQETLAELDKPMGMMSYLRWCYDIKTEIRPVHHPWLAEGTGTRKRKRPWSWVRIARAHRREVKERKRARRRYRQQRAAFRRRKRGLA